MSRREPSYVCFAVIFKSHGRHCLQPEEQCCSRMYISVFEKREQRKQLFTQTSSVYVRILFFECVIGHNEDALAEVLNHFYMVSAHIISEEPQGRYGTKEERFTSLCYAGHLPGYTSSYNHHGLAFTINTLCASNLQSGKTRKLIPFTDFLVCILVFLFQPDIS